MHTATKAKKDRTTSIDLILQKLWHWRSIESQTGCLYAGWRHTRSWRGIRILKNPAWNIFALFYSRKLQLLFNLAPALWYFTTSYRRLLKILKINEMDINDIKMILRHILVKFRRRLVCPQNFLRIFGAVFRALSYLECNRPLKISVLMKF